MTIHEILKSWLITNNYEGLYNDDDCGCTVDFLIPCGSDPSNCSPGYKVKRKGYDVFISSERDDNDNS